MGKTFIVGSAGNHFASISLESFKVRLGTPVDRFSALFSPFLKRLMVAVRVSC
jgi:hypothetical protein